MVAPTITFTSLKAGLKFSASLLLACAAANLWAEAGKTAAIESAEAQPAEAEAEERALPPVGRLVEDSATEDQTILEADSADSPPTDEPVEQYLAAIDRVEVNQGAYSPELADLYLGLGNSLVRDQKYVEARDAFQKGLQIDRINNGLNSLTQESYLFSLASLDSALGDRGGSNRAMNNLLQISSATYGSADERMLPVLEKMLQWYLGNYQYQAPVHAYNYLLNSEQLANHIALIHLETLALEDARAPESFRSIGVVEYALARYIDKHGVPGEEKEFTYSFGAQSAQIVNESAIIDRYYRRGANALQSVVKLRVEDTSADRVEQAEAIAELGDWFLAFDKTVMATKQYLAAYELLGDQEDAQSHREDLFAAPRLIDFQLNAYDGGTHSPENASSESIAQENIAPGYLEVTFDISEQGEPQNLKLAEFEEKYSHRTLRKLKREIMKLRFRPKISEGAIVGTSDYVYRHNFVGEDENSES